MIFSFKRTLLSIALLSSSIFGQMTKISRDLKTSQKLVNLLENKYSKIITTKLTKDERKQELVELQDTISYLSSCISMKKDDLEKIGFITTGCCAISLYTLFRCIDLNSKNLAIFGKDTKFNNFILSLNALTSVVALGLTVITLKNYYITKLLTDDLTEQEKEQLAQDLIALHKKIAHDLEKLNKKITQ